MTLAISTEGFIGGGAGRSLAAPVIANEPAAFPVTFREASATPYTFTLTGIPAGALISIAIKLASQDETIIALDFDGLWSWPFDVQPDNSIGTLTSEPVAVTLHPRGGWPPGVHTIKVAAVAKASAP